MNRSAGSVTKLMDVFVFTLAPTLFETLLVTFVFFQINEARIALVVLVSVAFYFFFTIKLTAWRTAFRRKVIDADNAVSDQTFESLTGIENIKSFGVSARESTKFDGKALVYATASNEMYTTLEFLNAGQAAIRACGLCCALLFAAQGTVRPDSRISAGMFTAISLLVEQLFRPLAWLGSSWRAITNAFTDLELACVMLRRVPAIVDEPDATELPVREGGGELSFENVSFDYPLAQQQVLGGKAGTGLKAVTFSVTPGKNFFVGLCGPTGGKLNAHRMWAQTQSLGRRCRARSLTCILLLA